MGTGSAVFVDASSVPVRSAAERPRTTSSPAAVSRALALGLPVLLAIGHASLLGSWLIDDAGISFAYARNLGQGHGLVSQPGVPPLEGFSNPLWTVALAPLLGLGLDPVWLAKVVSLLLLGVAFAGVSRPAGEPRRDTIWIGSVTALLLALDTSFMVWTTSGLENPLLAALLVWSASLAMDVRTRPSEGLAGAVAGLLALTRPDALIYAPAYLVALAASRPAVPAFPRRAARYAFGFACTFGPYLLFRRLYFGDWVPNTFHAKVRPWMLSLEPGRIVELLTAGTGQAAWLLAALAGAAAVVLILRRRLPFRAFVLGTYGSLAAAAYLLLPPDWMGEFRFATGFFLFLYWMVGLAAAALWTASPRARGAVAAGLGLLLAESTAVHASRTLDFAAAPTVPLARISAFAEGYDALAAELGPGAHTLLTPDLGGMLLQSDLRIYDLAGLCDRTIARTLMGDTAAFHEYVFETVRPTFIHVHGTWARWAALGRDPRFPRDYAVVHEAWAPGDAAPRAGDYVRRDAVASPERLGTLRARFRQLGLDAVLP